MAKVKKKVSTTYILILNSEERRWLMGVLQNAFLHSSEAYKSESGEDGEMRSSLYRVLQDCEEE